MGFTASSRASSRTLGTMSPERKAPPAKTDETPSGHAEITESSAEDLSTDGNVTGSDMTKPSARSGAANRTPRPGAKPKKRKR